MPFKRQKSNVSPHYHDTRTLLRKYRDVMWNLEVSDLDLQEEFKAEYGLSTDALFVDSEVNKGGNRLESYARALERSKKMMQIIDTAIDLMRRKHKKGEFYYWILYYAQGHILAPGADDGEISKLLHKTSTSFLTRPAKPLAAPCGSTGQQTFLLLP